MKGITFGNYHTYRDFGLLLTSKELGAPTAKVSKIDIPGADGALDMTEFHGTVKYENAKHRFDFAAIVPHGEQTTLFSSIKNAIHGKRGRIIIDDDPSFFYLGRYAVSSYTNEKGIFSISVECDCEPYKYKLQKTIVTKAMTGTQTITLTNGRKRAVPTITATAPMTIAFADGMWAHGAGTFTIPELELSEGENHVTVTGNGSISFEWREGDL